MSREKSPLDLAEDRVKHLAKQLDEYIKIVNVLVVCGKLTQSDVEAARSFVSACAVYGSHVPGAHPMPPLGDSVRGHNSNG